MKSSLPVNNTSPKQWIDCSRLGRIRSMSNQRLPRYRLAYAARTLAAAFVLSPLTLHAASDAARGLEPVRMSPAETKRAAPPPPRRAYAIDGQRFYYEGQQFIIDGLQMLQAGGELAKQRLQQILDSGDLQIAPLGDAVDSVIRARVSIDGVRVGAGLY